MSGLNDMQTKSKTVMSDQIEVHLPLSTTADLHLRYEQCAEILDDLGIRSVRLLPADPQGRQVLEERRLKVVEQINRRLSLQKGIGNVE